MIWLFTRPHPIAEALPEGHRAIIVPVEDYTDEDDEQIGRSYPLKRLLTIHDPDILFLVGLGTTHYARGTVLKWNGYRKHTVVGTTNRRGYGRVRGCNVGANHCDVFLTDDPALAKEHTSGGRTALGGIAPLMAAIAHARSGQSYSRKCPRPWQ